MAYYGSGSDGILARGIFKLQEIGVMDVIVPFILVFTIVFAVMQKTKILGTEDDGKRPKKNFNAVIALVMALAVIVPHITGSYPSPESDVVNIVNSALPNISVVLIAVVMMLLMIGVFGGGVDIAKSKNLATGAVAFAILATIFIFGTAAEWWNLPSWLGFMNDSDTQALVIIILVFGALIMFITGEDKPKDPKTYGFGEDIARAMGYKKD